MDKVTISLSRYHELIDAEKALIEIEKGYNHTFYSKEVDSLDWYKVKTSDEEIAEVWNQIKKNKETIKALNENLNKKDNKLKYLKEQLKPWYKRILKL